MKNIIKEIVKSVISFLAIMLLGCTATIYISPMLTTNYIEYMALCVAIIFHSAIIYLAITKKR